VTLSEDVFRRNETHHQVGVSPDCGQGLTYRSTTARFPMNHTLVAIFLFATTVFAQDHEMLQHFDYDRKAPLDVQEIGVVLKSVVRSRSMTSLTRAPRADGCRRTW